MRLERSPLTWSDLRVGIFVLTAIALLVAIFIFISGSQEVFGGTRTVEASLSNAQGLQVGDAAMVAGIEVGEVGELRLNSGESSVSVLAILSITDEAAQHLRQDAYVEVRGSALSPNKYLEIIPGSPDSPPWEPDSVLLSHEAPGLGDLTEELIGTVGKLNAVLEQSRALFTRMEKGEGSLGKFVADPALYEHLDQVLAEATGTIQRVNQGTGPLSHLLNSQQMANDLQHLLMATEAFVRKLNAPDSTLGKLANDPTLHRDIRQLTEDWSMLALSSQTTARRLEGILQSLQPTVERLAEGEGSIGRLFRDSELHDNLSLTTAEAASLMREAREGEGLIGKLIQDAEVSQDVSQTIRTTAELMEKLNTPGGTLDKLATESDLYQNLFALSESLRKLGEAIQTEDGTIGTLVRDEALPQELRQLIKDMNILVTDMEANPERYVHLSLF